MTSSVGQQRYVLVVESTAENGQALARVVEAWGHAITVATTGREAILRTLNKSPDVIVIALALPDIDGCRVVKRIRAGAVGAAPVIIAYSGYADRERDALAAGCDAFVPKPNAKRLEPLLLMGRAEMRRQQEPS